MSLLSKSTVQKILSEDKERKDKFAKKAIPAGEHILSISNVELTNSKSTNDPMLIMEFAKDGDHATIRENYMLAGNGKDIGLQRIITFMASAFKHEMEECETEKDLLVQLLKFKNKKFKAAVRVYDKLYTFTDKEQKPGMAVGKESKLWYCSTADDTSFKVNIAKTNVPLSAADKEKYMEFKKLNPDGNGGAEYASEATPGTHVTEEQQESDLPF